jgi:2-deoxy-D-gluconate 3-dehydrogenase
MPEMNRFELRGKVAIVTGGNGGIGLGIARGLAEAGADLVIAGRNTAKTQAAIEELSQFGHRVVPATADVTQEIDVKALVAHAFDALGSVDILVANAGTNIRKRPEAYTMDEWHHIIDTNLTSTFACCQAVYPHMRDQGGGAILTIGSMTSLLGFSVAPAYAASKGGIVQLTRSLATAWAAEGVRVNCILPGWIDTDMTIGARANLPQLHDDVLARTPARRWGRPDDLAGAAVFLCSAASEFVTGVALPVDGGFSSAMFCSAAQ